MNALPPLIGIVAMTSSRLIGKAGTLPWHLPEDLKFFKKTTLGHPIVMGRKTFDSIGRPLPKRQNIVLTKNPNWQKKGVTTIGHLEELQEVLPGSSSPAFIIGGAEIYRLSLPHLSSLYVSEVHGQYQGDTFFPPFQTYFPKRRLLHQADQFTVYEYCK